PRRSAAEMDALVASGRVEGRPVPGALSPHEEYPDEIAEAIRAA
ncbi:alpha/beta hydrolase, partial [Methylobacterium sp. WL103]